MKNLFESLHFPDQPRSIEHCVEVREAEPGADEASMPPNDDFDDIDDDHMFRETNSCSSTV